MESQADSFFSVGLGLTTAAVGSRRQALHNQLKAAIVDGRLAPGVKLPASRALARYLGVSRNSVVAVYDRLLSEGYIVARQGAGSFTAQSESWASSLPEPPDPLAAQRLSARWRTQAPVYLTKPRLPIDFTPGASEIDLFPHDIWRRLISHASGRTPDHAGGDRSPYGLPVLQRAIAGHVSLTRAVACNAKDVLVTHGAQQAFDLLARILVDPGRTEVVVEDPGYPPVRTAFAAAGALLHPVRVDREGLVVDDIPPTAKVISVTPSHQFPLGVPMSPRRRLQLLEFAGRADAVIIEDDYDGEYRFQDKPLDALQTLDRRQRVFYVGTFSKCMKQDLRLGFVVCPAWALDAAARAKQLSDGYCSAASQHALAAFISEGHLARHVRRMRAVYARRRAILLGSLEDHCGAWLLPFPALAGLHIAAALTGGGGASALVAAAAQAGIGIRTIAEFAVGADVPVGLVLGYGSVNEDAIASAMITLGEICSRLQFPSTSP